MNAIIIPGIKRPTIKTVAAKHFNIPETDIDNNKLRTRELADYRQFVMYVHQVFLGESQKKAGSVFGKDHATAFHAKQTVCNLIETDKIFREKATKAIEDMEYHKLI